MEPIGPLMMEHRLIERMLQLVQKEIQEAEAKQRVDGAFVDAVVDFIRWYADRTHHGKEEAILFRDAAQKELSSQDRALLNELIADHNFGRRTVTQIAEAKGQYLQGSEEALKTLSEKLRTLIDFYHQHIQKEDKFFFPAAMIYFSEQEQKAMLEEFWQADRKMIHTKYGFIVGEYEKQK
ncbi:MAG: hemerythrin domain-containing protein [Deltaproteobacteria bacterium]|nr:hemerythrin domain-containing protein [Deltaproteobacteria bacterium]